MSNVSVSSLDIQPTILGVNRPVQISAAVSNTGTQPMAWHARQADRQR